MKFELFFFIKSVLKEAISMRLLQEPVTIKNVTLKNRLVMPPMATEKADGGDAGPVRREDPRRVHRPGRNGALLRRGRKK
ncbi:hypothetical protein [Pyramidobacter porci]